MARRLQQLADEQTGCACQQGQITYQAIAADKPPGKPLKACRKVPVHLTLMTKEDAQVWAREVPEALRRLRVYRLIYEALLQGGALSQQDLACILGVSRKTIQRISASFRKQGEALPSRGEIQDMGRGVSHKVPVIGRYVQDLSFSRISRELGKHGISSMARYLRHFALVMILEDRQLTPVQMQSVIGISEKAGHLEPEICRMLSPVHDLQSVENCAQTYKNVLKLLERGFTPTEISGVLSIGKRLVNSYVDIVRDHHPEIMVKGPPAQELPYSSQ